MKEKWKTLERLLEAEYSIDVQASYEGWGAGYDPKVLPLTEMWARGEVEDPPEYAKRPLGVAFYVPELAGKSEDLALNAIRHEINYLFSTDLYLWKLGQREFFKFGFTPTSFLVLYSVLESIKTDEDIAKKHPYSAQPLKERYKNLLKEVEATYPHHRFALSFLRSFVGQENLSKELDRFLYEYLSYSPKEAYNLLIEELLGKYIAYIERSQELNYIDLLIDEARGKARKDAHKGRIMTDLLKRLPQHLQDVVHSYKEKKAEDIPEEERKEILKSLRSMPEWMRDYIKQMSYIDMVERDVAFIRHFLPKTLEVELEHRGFLSFVIKGWEEVSQGQALSSMSRRHKGGSSQEDRLYQGSFGLGKEEFAYYRRLLKSVAPYIETLKRRLRRLLPEEEEGWEGGNYSGKRLNLKALSVEVPTGRGRLYMRRNLPVKKSLSFKLLLDVSSSMKKEGKIEKALRGLMLFCEVLDSLKMPFSVDIFNDRAVRIKSFEEEYKDVRWKLIELLNYVGGATDLEKALLYALEDLEVHCKKENTKGCIVVFSDGEPTRGLRGQELVNLIRQVKAHFPVVGVGVGKEKNYIDYYFERTGIKVKDLSDLPLAFSTLIENQARRLLSFQ